MNYRVSLDGLLEMLSIFLNSNVGEAGDREALPETSKSMEPGTKEKETDSKGGT